MIAAIEGRAQALRREVAGRGWLAWHIVALDRTKQLPPLDRFTGEKPSGPRYQTAVEMEAAARQWAESFAVH